MENRTGRFGLRSFQTFWRIERSGPNVVNIAASDSIVLKDDDIGPPFAVETLVYNVRIDESDKMILNYARASSGVIFTYVGIASIIDGKLIAQIQETSNIGGFLSSRTLVFRR